MKTILAGLLFLIMLSGCVSENKISAPTGQGPALTNNSTDRVSQKRANTTIITTDYAHNKTYTSPDLETALIEDAYSNMNHTEQMASLASIREGKSVIFGAYEIQVKQIDPKNSRIRYAITGHNIPSYEEIWTPSDSATLVARPDQSFILGSAMIGLRPRWVIISIYGASNHTLPSELQIPAGNYSTTLTGLPDIYPKVGDILGIDGMVGGERAILEDWRLTEGSNRYSELPEGSSTFAIKDNQGKIVDQFNLSKGEFIGFETAGGPVYFVPGNYLQNQNENHLSIELFRVNET